MTFRPAPTGAFCGSGQACFGLELAAHCWWLLTDQFALVCDRRPLVIQRLSYFTLKRFGYKVLCVCNVTPALLFMVAGLIDRTTCSHGTASLLQDLICCAGCRTSGWAYEKLPQHLLLPRLTTPWVWKPLRSRCPPVARQTSTATPPSLRSSHQRPLTLTIPSRTLPQDLPVKGAASVRIQSYPPFEIAKTRHSGKQRSWMTRKRCPSQHLLVGSCLDLSPGAIHKWQQRAVH